MLRRIFPYLILVTISFFLLLSGCKKKDSTIPNTYVDIYIDVTSTQYSGLSSVGGWVYLTGGEQGIIVYRKSIDEFSALDRSCSLQSDSCERVIVESSGITAIDSICKSKFLLTDGSPFQGPATVSLKQYNTSFNGTTLHIFN